MTSTKHQITDLILKFNRNRQYWHNIVIDMDHQEKKDSDDFLICYYRSEELNIYKDPENLLYITAELFNKPRELALNCVTKMIDLIN